MDDKHVSPREYASLIGKKGAAKGGRARAATLTEGERKEIARNATVARWRKVKGPDYQPPESVPTAWPRDQSAADAARARALPYSMFQGQLSLGGLDMECHVLNDGRRVFTQREVVRALSGGRDHL